MKRILNFLWVIGAVVSTLFLGMVSTAKAEERPLQVVTSFSIITDMVEQIGGDYVEVHNLVPIGTDPHEYEPLPEDIVAATDADLMFYFGLNLEGSDKGWFKKLANSANQTEDALIEVAKEVEPQFLKDEVGAEEINPHAFLSPKVGIITAERVVQALKEQDPQHAKDYETRGQDYIEQLKVIDRHYNEQFGRLEDNQKNFMTSEYAFQYVANEYGLNHGYIWAIDTDENGSPEQIRNAVDWVKDHELTILFLESNVDPRPMETVSKETDVEIFDQPVYSDEVGDKASNADTYLKMLEKNLEVIYAGLTK